MKTISIIKLTLFLLILNIPNIATASSGGGNKSASKYFQLSPQIVVNVNDKVRARHLQIAIQLRLDNPDDSSLVNEHKPAIQHTLVMLLSGREAEDVRSTQGKEALRLEATEELKKLLEENISKHSFETTSFGKAFSIIKMLVSMQTNRLLLNVWKCMTTSGADLSFNPLKTAITQKVP